MDPARRQKPGVLDAAFRLITKRNSVYVSFILIGALVGERIVDAGTNQLWEYTNRGKLYEDIPVLGQRVEAAEE